MFVYSPRYCQTPVQELEDLVRAIETAKSEIGMDEGELSADDEPEETNLGRLSVTRPSQDTLLHLDDADAAVSTALPARPPSDLTTKSADILGGRAHQQSFKHKCIDQFIPDDFALHDQEERVKEATVLYVFVCFIISFFIYIYLPMACMFLLEALETPKCSWRSEYQSLFVLSSFSVFCVLVFLCCSQIQ